MPRRSHYYGWACAVVLLAGSLAFSGRMSRRAIRNSSLEEIIRNDPAYYASTLQKGKATKAATSAEAASPPDDDEAASASALAASEAVSNARRVRQENTAVEEDGGNGNGGRPDLEIVTAFSDNHALESVLMFQSLIRQQQGRRRHGSGGFGDTRIGVYLMRRPEDQDEDGLSTQHTPLMLEYRRVLLESPLNVDVYDYVVEENYTTYCFKPKIVSDFLYGRGRYRSSWDGGDVRGGNGSSSTDSSSSSGGGGNTGDRLPLPKVVMWADASTRYPADPNINARNMVKDGVHFAGKLGLKMGMGESTHDGTYSFFGMDRIRFRNRREISATHFLVNLMSPDVVSDVLLPYINCGTNACHRCMAPPGSSKYMDGRTIRGPPSTSYVAHRQDQSVLGLLVYDYMLHRNHTRNVVALDDKSYMHYAVSKTTKAKSVRDLLRDVVGGAGGSSGGAEKKK